MLNRILLVEDEDSIRSFLKINFKRSNFEVFEAASGEEAIRMVNLKKPDVVVLDIMLPGIDGFEVCKILRKNFTNIGIIMLTAKSQDMDKIMGLEFGADDYMVKPFNPLELILRVKALLRRIDQKDSSKEDAIIESPPFKINTYSKKVYKNNKELDLTPKEYLLMLMFLKNPGKAFKRDELLNIVWGYTYIGDSKIVDVNIRRLRKKIEDCSSSPRYIQTVWGTGYRWNALEEL